MGFGHAGFGGCGGGVGYEGLGVGVGGFGRKAWDLGCGVWA